MLDFITESKWYKVMMPKLYGWGAAIVILGALFKIEHMAYNHLDIDRITFVFDVPHSKKNP